MIIVLLYVKIFLAIYQKIATYLWNKNPSLSILIEVSDFHLYNFN